MPATRLKIGGTLASDAQLAGWLDDLLNGANGLQFRRAAVTTAGQDIFDISGVWNGAGQTLDGLVFNVTDTASAAGSRLLDLRVGGVSFVQARKDGSVALRGPIGLWSGPIDGGLQTVALIPGSASVSVNINGAFSFGANTNAGSTQDLFLRRDAANTLAQYNGTAAQTFNIYNTRTDGSNWERGFLRWSGNTLQIGTEALGLGTQRPISAIGNWTFASGYAYFSASSYIGTEDGNSVLLYGLGGRALNARPTFLRLPSASMVGWAATADPRDATDTAFIRSAAQVIGLTNGSTGASALEFREQTATAAGAANTARLHAFDDTAGNTIPGAMDSAGKVRTMGRLGPMTLAQLQAYPTTTLIVGVTEAHVTGGPAPGVHRWTDSGWAADVVNQVLDVVSQTATGTALSGACLYGGIRIRSGSPTLTVYDNTRATGTAIHTITAGSASGGPLNNGWYPWASLGGMRANTTGVHVVLSGTGVWDVIVTAA